ncbi:glycosyltransferase [Pediococcus argentinicus]|uniref:glycosyltransferase n=1 Tax=Pediococcus argentinicus TaxID=480391 RepID=UPI00338DCCDE
MFVVHFAEYASGGVATYIRLLINNQANDSEIKKIVLVISDKNSEDFYFDSEKVVVERYKYSRGFVGLFVLVMQLFKIGKLKPSIVHLHSTFAGLSRIMLFLVERNYQVIYCAHGWAFLNGNKISSFKNKLYITVEKLLLKVTDRVINISKYENDASVKLGFAKNKLILIRNSVQLVPSYNEVPRIFSGNGNKYIKLLFVGRLDTQKGIDILIDAVKDDSKFVLSVIGDTVLNSNDTFENSQNIRFEGWKQNKDVDSYIRQSDAVIIPSRWEGFGLVALEAMRNKKAVVASDSGALPDIVLDGQTGYVFKNGDVESLKKVLAKLSARELKSMGEAGYKRCVEFYNPDDMFQSIKKLYKECLKR